MKAFVQLMQKKFAQMQETDKLFRVALTGDKIWELYLKSFSKEDDPVFRDPNSTTHNCNHCKNFIRRYGNIVTIDEDYDLVTMFDVKYPKGYRRMATVAEAIKASKITEVFFETFNELNSLPYESCSKTNEKFQLGMSKNVKQYNKDEAEKYGIVKEGEIRTFDHMHLFLDKQFVDQSGKSAETIMGEFRDAKNVFQRAMEEISMDTLELVGDLINQGSLLDGTTHLHKVEEMMSEKADYEVYGVTAKQKDNWCWEASYRFPLAKFKNELIGVLCSELSEGEELNKACQSWNKRVDPVNYMKTAAPITKKQIEEAEKFVQENGYAESFDRKFANIDDIKVSEILHSNVGDGKVKDVSIFDKVKASSSTRHKRSEFDGVEEVSIDKFMKDILSTCSSIEAFFTSKQEGNLVSLTTANKNISKPIFKWDNNYSWTFNGNLAGKSQIKQAVKDAGGNVEGVLNFRLAWNDTGCNDNSDLDAWAKEPNGVLIGYSTGYRKDQGGKRTSMFGQLDVDNTQPSGKLAVENITWIDKSKMKDGVYKFWVNQFSARDSQGFKVEIEFDGETYLYNYDKPLGYKENVIVAEVTLKNGEFIIKHKLPVSEGTNVSKEIYGLETNQFHRVNLVCLSPNHWGSNKVGNKHYFFMLDGCKSLLPIRSFHNENLLPELAAHRKVLEVLGATNMIAPTDKQLSGLGFNATVKDELIVKLQGTHKRMVKIKF